MGQFDRKGLAALVDFDGTATVSLQVVPFVLGPQGQLGRRFDKELPPNPKEECAKQRAAKRKVQHETEMLALEWSKIMLEKHIYAALDPQTDPALAAKLRNDILNRGVGRIKEQEDDDENAKKSKGGGIAEFIDALAVISTAAGALERIPPAPTARIERDVTVISTDADLQQLLDDLDNDIEEEDSQ